MLVTSIKRVASVWSKGALFSNHHVSGSIWNFRDVYKSTNQSCLPLWGNKVFPVGVWCFSARVIFLSGEFATPQKVNMEQRYQPGFKNGKGRRVLFLMYLQLKVWHKTELGSGFNDVLFSPLLWGRWTHFDSYFLIGLKPPSREYLKLTLLNWMKV